MGHADVQTTMRYAHHVPKHNAADRFSAFVASQRADVASGASTALFPQPGIHALEGNVRPIGLSP